MALRVRLSEGYWCVTVNRYNSRELTTVESMIFRLTGAPLGPAAVPFGVLNRPENVLGVAGQSNNKETGSIRPLKVSQLI